MADITLSKGGITVIIYVREIADNLANQIFLIKPPQSKNNQSSGPKPVKVIDLLRITREYLITGELTGTSSKTAKQVKDDLYLIAEGGGVDGGLITLVYDGDNIEGFIEKVSCKQKAQDEPIASDYNPPLSAQDLRDNLINYPKYEVQVNFFKGIPIG